jgi:Lrp/AsnC family leucine-responsive transcriptional regulator
MINQIQKKDRLPGECSMDEIDQIDRQLLRLLQSDGRMTNVELARRGNLSPAACHDRLKRLQRDGYIQKFAALLDPVRIDLALLIFIEVVLDRTTVDVFESFALAVREMPEVLECHMVAGGFDYLIKARVRDMAAYRNFLGDSLIRLPGVRETHTYAVMEEVKNTTELPI